MCIIYRPSRRQCSNVYKVSSCISAYSESNSDSSWGNPIYNNGENKRYSFLNKLPFASATKVLLEWWLVNRDNPLILFLMTSQSPWDTSWRRYEHTPSSWSRCLNVNSSICGWSLLLWGYNIPANWDTMKDAFSRITNSSVSCDDHVIIMWKSSYLILTIRFEHF